MKIAFLLCLCFAINTGYSQTQYWKYIGAECRNSFHKTVPENAVFVPFEDVLINKSILDSMGKVGGLSDSMNKVYGEHSSAPVVRLLENKLICYSDKREVNGHVIYSFLIGDASDFTEHNCTLFYYMSEVGVIIALHHQLDDAHLFRNWDRYLIAQMSGGKHTISSEKLSEYVKEAIEVCDCPNP